MKEHLHKIDLRTRLCWTALLLSAATVPTYAQIETHTQAVTNAQIPTAPEPPSQAPATAAAEIQGGTIAGTVVALSSGPARTSTSPKVAGTPLPGVTVTATNTLTGKKYAAATDVTGSFRMAIPRNGRYVLRAEFAAFAPATAEVILNATAHTGTAAFEMELSSRAAQRTAASGTSDVATALQGLGAQALGRGVQSLNASGTLGDTADASAGGGNAGAALPSLGALGGGSAGGSDSVAVSGQVGQTNGLANVNEDDIRDRIESAVADARRSGGAQADVANAVVGMIGGMMAGGGFGGPGGFGGGGRGGSRGGGGGGGGFRNFNPTQIHGNLFYAGGNAALDATQFSLTGNAFKPAYSTNRYGGSLAGSPYIPGLTKPSTKQFVFLNVSGQRNENPTNIYGTVPTLAERGGDFSGLTQTVNGAAAPVPIYDPTTGQPFANNTITAISPQAAALLQYLPLPNSSTGSNANAQIYNYQRITTAGQNSLLLASRYVRNFGSSSSPFGAFGGGGRGSASQSNVLRINLNTGFNYSHSASDLRGFAAPFDGKSSTDGYNLNTGVSVGKGRLNSNASLSWNRSSTLTTNIFTGTAIDPAAGLNIPRPTSLQPGFYNGLPTLSFTDFSSFAETNPANRVQQTISWGDAVRWNHKKHNLNIGFDVRHVQNNVLAGTNVVGQYTFTGYATQARGVGTGTDSGRTAQALSGSSFADFLLGAPQQSKIQAGLYKTHLRESVVNAYGFDDWRALPNLTLNVGLRYEYFSPYVETDNRLVNLDHNADFTAISPVLPNGNGQFTGRFPRSLVNPDRTMLSPRIGIAYRPKFVKQTVLRAGYGINYNTGQFGTFANSLSYQQPFAVTQTNTADLPNATTPSGGCGSFVAPGSTLHRTFTLATAFDCSTGVSNNFAVNRDYRLGRVQAINAGVQHTFPLGVVFNADYNGSFGGNLDLLRAPGRNATNIIANSQSFTYEDSVADSRFQSLILNARKRLQKGIAVQATYQYGHSIDNASSIGGSGGSGGNTVVQNDQRLDLEYGNSTFDVRHRLTGNFVTELPFGPNRAFLSKGGLASKVLDGFSVSGDFTFATGTYATPQYVSSVAQTATGGNYTLRPDRVFSQPIAASRTLTSWFNRDAFTSPAAPNGFGTASRNSIELPGVVAVNMSLSRTVSFGELRSFEARATASNVFNTVQYSGVNTTLNSATFGQVTGTTAPRKLTVQARYRF